MLLKELGLFDLIIILLSVTGAYLLIQVGFIIWNDLTIWGKDFNSIFFGSRSGETISLGIGLQIVHYYLTGIFILFSAISLFFLKQENNKKIS